MEAIYLTRSLFIITQSKQADQQHPDNGLLLEWRPGQPVLQRRLAALLPDQQPSTGHKPAWQLSGECRGRIVLQFAEKRADQKTYL